MLPSENKEFSIFLKGKPDHTLQLFDHFVYEYQKLGKIELLPAKTMIGISNGKKRIVYITQFGKNFILLNRCITSKGCNPEDCNTAGSPQGSGVRRSSKLPLSRQEC